MTIPKDTLWKIDPHTQVKHEILRRYLGAWFGILGQKYPLVIYLDGFCGPGRYNNGELGSPIIALQIALAHNINQKINEASFLFIDSEKDRISHLKKEIKLLDIPPNFHIESLHNEFEDTLTNILDDLDEKGQIIAPTFAFIDPFGFKGAPYKLIKRILSNNNTEILINIMVNAINRWLRHPNEQTKQHIVELFGTQEVLNIINGSGDRVKLLRVLYQQQLSKVARFVRYFEMCDECDRQKYYLFFASNNSLGHKRIKEAFWKMDTSSGYKFSDKTNPDQLVLVTIDPSYDLEKDLFTRFSGLRISVETIKTYVNDETPYLEKHMRSALKNLEEDEKIIVDQNKQDGKKRVGKYFTDGVIVNFSTGG